MRLFLQFRVTVSIKKIFFAISADIFDTCEICVIALFCDEKISNSFYMLTGKKDNGGLVYPSSDVVKVISVTESICKERLDSGISSELRKSGIKNNVMQHLRNIPLFTSLLLHDIECHKCLFYTSTLQCYHYSCCLTLASIIRLSCVSRYIT